MAETVERNHRKIRQGTVVSDKMNKTIVVRLDRTRPHALYNKTSKSTTKLYAHDENNDARPGDLVRVMETRRLSHKKRWRLIEIVERAK
ncbi:MAG TPA: 30S ribosomal protein S17 [candidate division Zixibacteria bacterium]|nr:30S ribosomal protein S17 [candidate division Zixibacteria bacterium]MDD4918434.1 30S ribosomal protein S17 [candidate division Zixibacteria bacterium]MDM7971761.1 30S ribosomal protein S17 [candidate division Zixibacteria bacterium]HOD67531.1 30S ribosomal protein S17 [candidate division Zixibacteria bacterium]HOZ07683.1 30S ribosomal protein S17 [candidate division Zixibacteria bacterium]